MKAMQDLQEMGMVTDEYFDELKKDMKKNDSLETFEKHLDKVSGRQSQEFRGSGGNKKHITGSQRRAKIKAQKKARKKARV